MMASSFRLRLPSLIVYFGGSFVLHLLWENLQAPLFEGFLSFSQHFWLCASATAGDMLFMVFLYATLAVMHRNLFWVARRSAYEHPATWFIVLFFGVLLGVSFELWAVYVDQRWHYNAMMPLIPILRVGLTPVLQMLILPLVTVFLTSRFSLRS